MTIYLDIIFLENLFMNYIIIFATGIIIKSPIKIIRTFLSSVIGSIYAILIYTNILEKVYTNIFLKIALSLVMVYIAFNPQNLKAFLKQTIIFYLTSFSFGGVAFALLYFVNPQKILLKDGALIGTYPIKIILAGGILGFIVITTAFKNIKVKLTKKDMMCNIKINIDNKEIYLNSIIDTGNFLREPITKTPVIIVEKESLKTIVSNEILDNLDKIINGEDIELGKYVSKIRVIPFSSLGKSNGLLLGIKADSVTINGEEGNIYIENIIIGIYDKALSKSGKYKALIGLDLFEYEGGNRENEHIRNIKV